MDNVRLRERDAIGLIRSGARSGKSRKISIESRCLWYWGRISSHGFLIVALRLLVGADSLGQTPVEHHDLAEVSQHHVLPLEVAVDDAP
jgi:hypothetical protein